MLQGLWAEYAVADYLGDVSSSSVSRCHIIHLCQIRAAAWNPQVSQILEVLAAEGTTVRQCPR